MAYGHFFLRKFADNTRSYSLLSCIFLMVSRLIDFRRRHLAGKEASEISWRKEVRIFLPICLPLGLGQLSERLTLSKYHQFIIIMPKL